jgi:phosphate transport system permease protein
VRAWFYTNTPEATTVDGGMMVCAHEFATPGAAVTSLTVSDRRRMAVAGYADGKLRVIYVTSEKIIADLAVAGGQPIQAVALAPKEDGVVSLTAKAIAHWTFDPGYPEVSLAALFTKVWYEGYPEPTHTWQSSSGDDAFETKFGLVPLIYGTLKASFYALLFGVPLALLSAVYTSEFLDPRVKGLIKPTVELMASLPSVVLGFLAGLVFAQFVENWVPALLASMLTIPLAFLLGAYVLQMLPQRASILLARWRFVFILLVVPLGMVGGVVLGPLLEWTFFGGDFRAWLDGAEGSSIGGWMFLFVPLGGVATVALLGGTLNPWLRRLTRSWSRWSLALLDVLKFIAGCGFALCLAFTISGALASLGLDPRGTYIGPYSQRNALVVGFVMGFAIIPIIYTIAEDALSAVPEHLRSGSLAAGATRWQTASRIIVPTAMSGLFSAVMIGFGRAVGETMIVLMATGNTPVMNWNMFSGFRTLSANIAVELPEAVGFGTHFRILFVAALSLFAITFVLNTGAEIVRLRFRRRAYQL